MVRRDRFVSSFNKELQRGEGSCFFLVEREREGRVIQYTSYFRSCESPVSSLTVKYNKISGIQIAIEAINRTAITRQRPCKTNADLARMKCFQTQRLK